MSNLLYNDEGVEVDGGYRGNAKMKCPEIGFDYNNMSNNYFYVGRIMFS